MSLLKQPIRELHKRLKNRDLTASDLVDASLERIRETDSQIRAFLKVDEDGARERAKKLEGQSDGNPLAALPLGVKDNINTEGVLTTAGSKILESYSPLYNATVMEKLEKAGANMVGKMNMDEFGMGSSNENSGYFTTRNPWDLNRVPGGSSGGSAAAVATGQISIALGSDTGGSIRQPAAFCGVVGLKPTYGRVSRFGLIAFASSLDQIGPITRNVEDAAYTLQTIAGHDPLDSTSADVEVPDYLSALTGDIKGLKVAVPRELMGEGIDLGVKEQVEKALKQLEQLGAVVEEVSLPHIDYAVATYYLLAPAEASSNLARYDGVRYGLRVDGENLVDMFSRTRSTGFGNEVKRRIMLGTYALSSGYYDAYYLKAQKVRTLIRRDFEEIFNQYDVVVGPTAPTTAFKFGDKTDDPLTMYLNDICTIPVSLAGLPAISVPCGLSEGLPVGLQIIGRPFDEAGVLKVAHAYEQHGERLPEPTLGGEAR
ncbi:MAG: Asp-tRNA(Asn)/Glu-tRNA(Gln) amidotransferase subunit GatA [Firmicutes bacterium]|uniref:Glutamyl-tRNA(Gln) amidotransferase subunit A n=1 Tax=Melghirimyces thermohalophilus TaxID=1236220 RepID=A0A1G6I9F9_9BACL|nr:Asp-tRNA(Asn)/Glu-tRNA(Gln) amidotransferase subunit GatA [Melghirimyces thermohalophilus]MDA8351788.1 Asp-tRNA(Asn)/Glu-tRNA(Gln) amidotransferase subunit GatA [Bacillota bacterium]SDC03189.1 aspartyl/glutamyl-tRNA(Asn/Gln) amidotransferase subunit A [Melghirimyces thermohalophilus]